MSLKPTKKWQLKDMSLLKFTVVVATILIMVGCAGKMKERTNVCFGFCFESEIEAETGSCKPKIKRKHKAGDECSGFKNLSESH